MFEITIRDIICYALGAISILFVLKVFSDMFRPRRSSRNRRSRRRYDDDDYDDEEEDSPALRGFFLLVIVVGCMFLGYKGLQKAGVVKMQHDIPKPERSHKKKDSIELPFEYDEEASSDASLQESTPEAQMNNWYVRENVYSNEGYMERNCEKWTKKGLNVHTKRGIKGKAIYIGPYPTKEAAQDANVGYGIFGVVEQIIQ